MPIIRRNNCKYATLGICHLHTKQSSTQCDNYRGSHRYSYFSWWSAHSRPKHVEEINKHIKKNCAPSWLYLTRLYKDVRSTKHKIVIIEISLIHATNNNCLSRKQAIHLWYSYHIFLLWSLKWSSHLLPGLQSVIFHVCIARLHHPCSPNCITVTILRDLYKSRRSCMILRIPRLWTEHLRCSVKRHYRRHWGVGGASCLILRYIIKMKTAVRFFRNIGTCLPVTQLRTPKP